MTLLKKVIIIPCSGIGKSYGTVSREAAYQVTEDDRPDVTRLVPLARLVLGEAESRAMLTANPVFTIDGCKLGCATKMAQACGGQVAHEFAVLEAFRRYRDFKPQGITELNEGGLKLAGALAHEIDAAVDGLLLEGDQDA
jgi:uncharacterized metal-binding protein